MKILKLLTSWQFWVNLVLAVLIFVGLLQGIFLWLNAFTNHGVQVEVPNLNNLSLDQAVKKLEEIELEYEIDTSKYDPKYKSYQILDIYPLIGSNVKKGRRIFIRANAKTWKPTTVPNVIGKYKYLAFSQLDLVGLKIADTIYEPNFASNTVLRLLYKGKEIQPGETLPRFSPLTIVLAKSLAKNVSVPNFIGLNEETAKKMIAENLFSIGNITYEDPANTSNNRVYYQVPAPSFIYDQGQPIDIYLSNKPLDKLKGKIKSLDETFNIHKYSDSLNSINYLYDDPDNTIIDGNNVPSLNDDLSNSSGNNTSQQNLSNDNPIKKPKRVIIE